MANQEITNDKQNIESVILNALGAFNQDKTYQFQNAGTAIINLDIEIGNNLQTMYLLPYQIANYKHKDGTVISLYNGGKDQLSTSFVAITETEA